MSFRFLAFLLVVASLGYSSCASTRIHGVREPGFESVRYDAVVVHARVRDEKVRRRIEDAFVAELEEEGVRAKASLDLLNEPRKYTETEVLDLMRAEGWQAMLRVKLGEFEHLLVEQPGAVIFVGDGYSGFAYATPPYLDDRTRLGMHVDFLDAKTGRVAWEGRSRLGQWGDRLLIELVRRSAEDLGPYWKRKGLIGPPAPAR